MGWVQAMAVTCISILIFNTVITIILLHIRSCKSLHLVSKKA